MKDIVYEWYDDKKNVDEMIHWNKGRLKIWEQSVVKLFPHNAQILDIGCGMGREAFALSDMGFSVTGIDISGEVIRQVIKLSLQNGYNIPFAIYDGRTLPFGEASFDVIIIWAQTFGLLYGNEYKYHFINECKRVLKKDGLLSFSGHEFKYVKEHYEQYTIGHKFFPYANAEIYWELFSLEDLATYVEKFGMSVVICEQGKINQPEDGIILHCLCRK